MNCKLKSKKKGKEEVVVLDEDNEKLLKLTNGTLLDLVRLWKNLFFDVSSFTINFFDSIFPSGLHFNFNMSRRIKNNFFTQSF